MIDCTCPTTGAYLFDPVCPAHGQESRVRRSFPIEIPIRLSEALTFGGSRLTLDFTDVEHVPTHKWKATYRNGMTGQETTAFGEDPEQALGAVGHRISLGRTWSRA